MKGKKKTAGMAESSVRTSLGVKTGQRAGKHVCFGQTAFCDTSDLGQPLRFSSLSAGHNAAHCSGGTEGGAVVGPLTRPECGQRDTSIHRPREVGAHSISPALTSDGDMIPAHASCPLSLRERGCGNCRVCSEIYFCMGPCDTSCNISNTCFETLCSSSIYFCSIGTKVLRPALIYEIRCMTINSKHRQILFHLQHLKTDVSWI